jgi:hypothetical protein
MYTVHPYTAPWRPNTRWAVKVQLGYGYNTPGALTRCFVLDGLLKVSKFQRVKNKRKLTPLLLYVQKQPTLQGGCFLVTKVRILREIIRRRVRFAVLGRLFTE